MSSPLKRKWYQYTLPRLKIDIWLFGSLAFRLFPGALQGAPFKVFLKRPILFPHVNATLLFEVRVARCVTPSTCNLAKLLVAGHRVEPLATLGAFPESA